MKSFKLKQPTSLKEITLEQYQLWMHEIKNYEERRSNEELSEQELLKLDDQLRMKMVEIFCRAPRTAVRNMRRTDFINISNQLTVMLDEKPDLQPIIDIKGKKFGFIPDLQKELLMGEYIDLDDFMKEWESYHRAMGVLYRPVILGPDKHDRYTIVEYNELGEYDNIMKQLPMDIVMGAVVFFYHLSRQLLEIIPRYLQKQLSEKSQYRQALEKSGVGISTFTLSLEVACSKLKELQSYGSVKPYFS